MMTDSEEDKRSSFKVSDRRLFTPEGEVRAGMEEKAESDPTDARRPPIPEAVPELKAEPEPQGDAESMTFASFLLSLATTGMVHLGEIPEPTTGQPMENLQAAGQMIDLLSLLQEKTSGNLSGEEAQLLEGLLYELRMKFLSKAPK